MASIRKPLIITLPLSWKYLAGRLFWRWLDMLFPPTCGGCDRAGFRWCPDCQAKVRTIPDPRCDRCGRPLHRPGLCAACSNSPPPYRQMVSWLIYEGSIRSAIHKLKYYRNLALGDTLAHHLLPFLMNLNWPVQMIVPVPLGRKRMRERGYNQVGMVALPLAVLAGWEYSPRSLVRIRETRSQVGLTPDERTTNVKGAFTCDPRHVSGKTVLLIDDVATTGATLISCTMALLEGGAQEVYSFTLARALPAIA